MDEYISYRDAQDVILRFAREVAPAFADRFQRWPDENGMAFIRPKLEAKIAMYRGIGIDDVADLLACVVEQMKREVK